MPAIPSARSLLLAALMALACGDATVAQICPGTGTTLLRNDSLAALPPAGLASAVSIIRGLCPGEGCAAVMDVSGVGASVLVNSAAVAYISPPPVTGLQAIVNCQIYDGITWLANGNPLLGPVIFDLAANGGSMQLTSSNINVLDLSGANVVASSGTIVVAFTMQFQDPAAGSCASGYQTNFATDNGAVGLACTTTPRRNLILLQGQGWRDASTAAVASPFGPVPLCPIFFNGDWIIRACVQPAPGSNPLSISYAPSATANPGGIVFVNFQGGPSFANQNFLALPSFSRNPAGSPLPFPLNDPLTTLYLAGDPVLSAAFTNFGGTLSSTGISGGIVQVPALPPSVLPFTLYTGFATFDASGAVSAASDAAPLIIQ